MTKLLFLFFFLYLLRDDSGAFAHPDNSPPSLKSNPRIPDRFTSVPRGKAEDDLVGAGVAPKAGTGNAAVGGEALPKAPKPLGPSASATPPSGGSGGGSPPGGSSAGGSGGTPTSKGSVSGGGSSPGGTAGGKPSGEAPSGNPPSSKHTSTVPPPTNPLATHPRIKTKNPLVDKLESGASPETVVPDDTIIIRGGEKYQHQSGGVISAQMGSNVADAASGLPHGTIRVTTAGEICAAGGKVELIPEPAYPGGPLNTWHVNVTEGSKPVFPEAGVVSPVAKENRLIAPKPGK